jgi:hypothetical protein
MVSQAQSITSLPGNPQQGLGLPPQYAVDAQGVLSSQFMQTPAQSQHYAVPPLAADLYPSTSTSTLTGSTLPSSSQPVWQVGSQVSLAQTTKPETPLPDVGVSSAHQLSQTQFNQHALSDYSQQQHSQQQQQQQQHNPGLPLPNVSSSPSQYPLAPALDSFGHPTVGQAVESVTLPGLSAPGVPLTAQAGQLDLITQQAQHAAQGPFMQNSQYQSYLAGLPAQGASPFNPTTSTVPMTSGSTVFNGLQSTGTLPYVPEGTPTVQQQNSHFFQQSNPVLGGQFGSHPQPSSTPNHFSPPSFLVELPDNQADPGKLQRISTEPISELSGNTVQLATLASTSQQQQQQQQQLSQLPPLPYSNASQWQVSNPQEQQRPAVSGPQFVSGPWASSGIGPSYPPSRHGYGGGGRQNTY